jgi:hypothetical protein
VPGLELAEAERGRLEQPLAQIPARLSGNTACRQERYSLHLDGSATFSTQAKTQTARYTTNFYYNRFFRVPWYTGTILNLLRSD